MVSTIKRCQIPAEQPLILAIINQAAVAYRGVIPGDCWHEPYMTTAELEREITEGVVFWGCWAAGNMVGVMGCQSRGTVDLIRHAYVQPAWQHRGVGHQLLTAVESQIAGPLLVGTWAVAAWAIDFYQGNGFQMLPQAEKDLLLRRYWSIPEQQMTNSVVLAKGYSPAA